MSQSLSLKVFAVLAVASVFVGCQKPDPVEVVLADKAPDYAAGGSMSEFVVGKWMVGTGDEVPDTKGSAFEFKADGTFTLNKSGHTFGGKWTESAGQINIEYSTLDGLPMQAGLDKIKKGEESGTQAGIADGIFTDWALNTLDKWKELVVADNKKTLEFKGTKISMGDLGGGGEGGGAPAQIPGMNLDVTIAGTQLFRVGLQE